MKLMIAIPTLDYIHFEFARCLAGLVKRLQKDGVDFDVCFKGGTLVYNGRDALAAEAVNSGYTHILWLDADMVFNDDVFYKLAALNKPFVTGVYHSRHAPYKSCIFTSLDPVERVEKYPKEPFEIVGCGFGMVLVETEVIRTLYRAYGNCFQPMDTWGEDIAFCIRAREQGYDLLCEPTVIAGHIGHVVVNPDMFGSNE